MPIFLCLLLLFPLTSQAWNAAGHRLVAQMAYDKLTPETQHLLERYNQAVKPKRSFVSAAVWLDTLRRQDVHWFDPLHYINIPFSNDKTSLPPVEKINVIWGVEQATRALRSRKSTEGEKGLALRMLIHLVADLHQPLHTASQVSLQYPKGDRGGSLFPLGKNTIGSSLHQYWDKGGGFLLGSRRQLEAKTKTLEKTVSCPQDLGSVKLWVEQSHDLAINKAYTIERGSVPGSQYQRMVQEVTRQQMILAACRLAGLLNEL